LRQGLKVAQASLGTLYITSAVLKLAFLMKLPGLQEQWRWRGRGMVIKRGRGVF
jgi:hypothetical protein